MFDDIFVFLAGVFAAQRQCESDVCISLRCAIPMFDGVFVFLAGVSAAQGQVESDVFAFQPGMCVRCSKHMLDGIHFFQKGVFAYKGKPKAILAFQPSIFPR